MLFFSSFLSGGRFVVVAVAVEFSQFQYAERLLSILFFHFTGRLQLFRVIYWDRPRSEGGDFKACRILLQSQQQPVESISEHTFKDDDDDDEAAHFDVLLSALRRVKSR